MVGWGDDGMMGMGMGMGGGMVFSKAVSGAYLVIIHIVSRDSRQRQRWMARELGR